MLRQGKAEAGKGGGEGNNQSAIHMKWSAKRQPVPSGGEENGGKENVTR